MTRHLIVMLAMGLAVAVGACVRDHGGEAIEVQTDADCVACHQADYDGATDPVHVGVKPTTCGNCHRTDAWQPALDGDHPEDAFHITTGAHQPFKCLECHDASRGSSVDGANTICAWCHTGAHDQDQMDYLHPPQIVPDYSYQADQPNFCLTCHPDGTAPKHPEQNFPIASGAHSGIQCYDCHQPAAGPNTNGENVSCLGCHEHRKDKVDDIHHEVGNYRYDASNPDFCRQCHPRGR